MNAENHITIIRSEASRIIYTLTRVVPYMELSKRHILSVSIQSSVTTRWSGCITIAQQIEK